MINQQPFAPKNFAGLAPPCSDLESSRVAVLPVAYDGTAEWCKGARLGPRAIIDASEYLELYDLELDREISEVGIHTLPELQPETAGPEQAAGLVYRVTRGLLEKGRMVVMLGGEHSLTQGAVRAYRERYKDLSVLQFDAHTDLRDSYQGTRFGNASVMRRVLELCPVVPVGVRSLSQEERRFIGEAGMAPFYAPDLVQGQVRASQVVAALSQHVYITIDLDVLDPSVMPAVGTPEPGGIGWYQLLDLLREVCRARQVLGFDVMELCPPQGGASCAYLAAKLAYKLIGYIFYGSR